MADDVRRCETEDGLRKHQDFLMIQKMLATIQYKENLCLKNIKANSLMLG